MSEASQYQRIRRYWKHMKNQHQRKQCKYMMYAVGAKNYRSDYEYYTNQAYYHQQQASDYHLLLNRFKDDSRNSR